MQWPTILVTGASLGISQALAIQLAELGINLIESGRDKEAIVKGIAAGKGQITPGFAMLVVTLNQLLPGMVAKMMMRA